MKRYINSLDGLRGLGILVVVLYHLLRLKGNDPSFFGFAWIAVQMFFVQSGYLITRILIHSKELSFKNYLKQFYWNRTLRIFPIYFLYLFLLTGIYFVFNIDADFPRRAIYLFTHTYNFSRFDSHIDFHPFYVHLWSLAVEEQFYLIWPLLIYFLSQNQIKIMIIVLIIICPVIRFSLGEYLLNYSTFEEIRIGEIIYGFTFSHFDAFATGGLIAVLNHDWLSKSVKLVIVPFVIGVIVILFINQKSMSAQYVTLSWTSLGLPLANLKNYQHVWSYSLVNVSFALLMFILMNKTYRGFFNWKPLVSLGKIAYSAYIFHFMILLIIVKYAPDIWFPILFFLSLLIVYLVGFTSYSLFEKKFLKYKSK